MPGSTIMRLVLAVGLAWPAHAQETAKERLGAKASDEQRIDNCKVPPERRGRKERPAECGVRPFKAAAEPPSASRP